MKYKIEKTEKGKIAVVKPKRKNASYGDVVHPEEIHGEPDKEASSGEQEPLAERMEAMEKLMSLVEAFKEQDEKEKKEKEESEGADGDGGKPQPPKPEPKVNEQLTRYLVLQLRLKALNQLFGSVQLTKEKIQYWTIRVVDAGHGMSEIKVRPQTTLVPQRKFLEVMPYFETERKAQAYFELLSPMLLEYLQLASAIEQDVLDLAQLQELKVIHK